MTLIAF